MAKVEPWLRGTHAELDPLRRAVLHALELAAENVARWTLAFDDAALEMEPMGLPSVGFQMRHIARSLDRLLTYADGGALSEAQLTALREEHVAAGDVRVEFAAAMDAAMRRVVAFDPATYSDVRFVGRDRLQVTVGALLIHVAEHTQRHAGQMVTTAKVIAALQDAEAS